jgi:CheY-like chemotaxis protein
MASAKPNPNGYAKQRFNVLIIENDPAAAVLTREAFKEIGVHESVKSVKDGEEAMAFLQKEEHQGRECQPDIIFLDLHLPKKSGLEVLLEIKTNPVWSVTPIVVVSGSADPAEIRRAYELHASCYVRKPSDLDEFLRFIRVCYEFWGSVATLPSQLAR